MKTEQDSSIRVEDLPEVVMGGSRLRLAEERLVPLQATGNVADANDRPRSFHRSSAVGLTSHITGGGRATSELKPRPNPVVQCVCRVNRRYKNRRTCIHAFVLGIGQKLGDVASNRIHHRGSRTP
jgi:hypothetical protein